MIRERSLCRRTVGGVFAALALLLASPAAADRVVDASEPVIISDDVYDRVTEVTSATSGGDGNSKNRSGLGDGTNPGQGSGTANSPNEGTDNPNQSSGGSGGKSTGKGKK